MTLEGEARGLWGRGGLMLRSEGDGCGFDVEARGHGGKQESAPLRMTEVGGKVSHVRLAPDDITAAGTL